MVAYGREVNVFFTTLNTIRNSVLWKTSQDSLNAYYLLSYIIYMYWGTQMLSSISFDLEHFNHTWKFPEFPSQSIPTPPSPSHTEATTDLISVVLC